MSVQVYSVPGQRKGKRKAFLEWASIDLSSNWVSRCILFLAKLQRRGRPFLEGTRRETALWDYPQEHLVVIRDEKVCLFVKFEIILSLLCCLLDLLTNKHCRKSFMINLCIDSRTCQSYRILLSATHWSNKLLRAFKRKYFGEYDAVTLTLRYLKVLHDMISQIFKLIFQKQPSFLRHICTEHWRKAPIFTAFLGIFLYLKNNNSEEHV